jgi:tRNA(fMet)-specific endonuclease VapC
VAVRIAIDTNRYRDLRDNVRDAVETVESAAEVFVPFVVAAELKTGFGQGNRRAQNERIFRRFLAAPGVRLLFADDLTIGVYTDLFLGLKARGRPIPFNDLWIAALCVQHGLTLYTRDSHFDYLPRLRRL